MSYCTVYIEWDLHGTIDLISCFTLIRTSCQLHRHQSGNRSCWPSTSEIWENRNGSYNVSCHRYYTVNHRYYYCDNLVYWQAIFFIISGTHIYCREFVICPPHMVCFTALPWKISNHNFAHWSEDRDKNFVTLWAVLTGVLGTDCDLGLVKDFLCVFVCFTYLGPVCLHTYIHAYIHTYINEFITRNTVKQSSNQRHVCYCVFLLYFLLSVLSCQHQCKWLPGKTRLWNDLLCVERDVKLYSLTHSLVFVL